MASVMLGVLCAPIRVRYCSFVSLSNEYLSVICLIDSIVYYLLFFDIRRASELRDFQAFCCSGYFTGISYNVLSIYNGIDNRKCSL